MHVVFCELLFLQYSPINWKLASPQAAHQSILYQAHLSRKSVSKNNPVYENAVT